MFDLEKAIAVWRQSFAQRRRFLKEDLDELERHVRDHVAQAARQGAPAERAFWEAVAEVGEQDGAEDEYRKVYWAKLKRQRRLKDELSWRCAMLKSYLTVTLRHLARQKGYAFINVAGLTIGLACCMVIFQYVTFERSFDGFHQQADRIYRVVTTRSQYGGDSERTAALGHAAASAYAQAVPEIVRFARIHPDFGGPVVTYLGTEGERTFKEENVLFVDTTFLEMFSFPLVKGSRADALRRPQTLLITESAARKYFGSDEPIGKVLTYTGLVEDVYTVVGVLKDVPANSHLRFDFLLPLQDVMAVRYLEPESGWDWWNLEAYVELRPDAAPQALEPKLTEVLYRHAGDGFKTHNVTASVQLQPLRRAYLEPGVYSPSARSGDAKAVYFFSLIALITLIIALINYVNLATARALGRAREVGVRKVVGAQRAQLVGQFLLESVLTNVAALLLAFALAVLLVPVVNRLAQTQLSAAMWLNGSFAAAFGGVFLLGVLLSGLYPAFVLSSFRPVHVLKGRVDAFAGRVGLRRGLVVLQFAASIVLLAGTAVVYAQLHHMRGMDVGVRMDQILIVNWPTVHPPGTNWAAAWRPFADEVRQVPGVEAVSFSFGTPGRGYRWGSRLRRAAADPATSQEGILVDIDHHFVDLYGMKLAAGRPFTENTPRRAEGQPQAVLINESAARRLGFQRNEDALDQLLEFGGGQFTVQGVMKDFNWSSLHKPADAVLFAYNPVGRDASLKVSAADLPATLAAIRRTYDRLYPGNPFEYTFADAAFDEHYRKDERFARLVALFAGFAMLIACLGLFGLAAYSAQQRTKEIGIRKAVGASVRHIIVLLSRDFMLLVAVAILVAVPVAYSILSRWLEGFAYRIELGPGVFLWAGTAALGIALATVSYQAVKAALADPVKSLRYE